MRLIDWLHPRDRRVAAHKVAIMTAVAAGVMLFEALVRIAGGHTGDLIAPVTTSLALFAVAVAFLAVRREPSLVGRTLWAVLPVAGVVLIAALDLATSDAGFVGLFSFVFPALYAASQLRQPGVILISGLVQTACAVVVFTVLPPIDAVVTMAYFAGIGLTATLLLFQSVERTARLVERLEQLAAVDPLTGLVTRRVLEEATRTALSRSPDVGTGLILVDVDHFKAINDRFGHPAGDEVLVQLAAVLRGQCRSTDVISRLGGDEIAILLPGMHAADLPDRAEALGVAVRGLTVTLPDGGTTSLSVSGGAAHAPSHAGDHRSLYTAADIALYEAKRSGRDRIVVSTGTSRVIVGPGPSSTSGRPEELTGERPVPAGPAQP
ncbi:GGDEF domain-containing protein [Nakamurella flava]|uniref:GGDEF domain-containing protein n=1 Tax=Nakamurella flava TaxID=2576308 RepID=A0A4U6Q801_9ACTN|nr:GGDEF domain-containing protein [Nakamurella flava]TKV56161.1 GGDEF domain-containing protein [Nakamurella flava]